MFFFKFMSHDFNGKDGRPAQLSFNNNLKKNLRNWQQSLKTAYNNKRMWNRPNLSRYAIKKGNLTMRKITKNEKKNNKQNLCLSIVSKFVTPL